MWLGLILIVAMPCGGRWSATTKPLEANNSPKLQPAVNHVMAGRSGTLVVVDVATGRILASHRLDIAARRLAPPGSTAKPFTLLALLEAQIVRPETPFVCPIKLQIGPHRMDCTHPRTPEPLDAASALAHSCNNYFARFAPGLDERALDHAFTRAGLTSATGEAPSEAAGRLQQSASATQHALKAIGAAGVEVTPLGLLHAYRRLALARERNPRDPAMNVVLSGLEASVDWGMARAARMEGFRVAGKTGTIGASRGNWTHSWFVGYAPADHPAIVLVVFLERGTGAADAAPLARQVFEAFRTTRRPA